MDDQMSEKTNATGQKQISASKQTSLSPAAVESYTSSSTSASTSAPANAAASTSTLASSIPFSKSTITPQPSTGLLQLPPEILDSIAFFTAVGSLQLTNPGAGAGAGAAQPSSLDAPSSAGEAGEEPVSYTDASSSRNLGPPHTLIPLLLTCRSIYASLSHKNNPRLYARIFRSKFDIAAIRRRFGARAVSTRNLADELARRFRCLKRIRRIAAGGQLRKVIKADGTISEEGYERGDQGCKDLLEDLWLAFMMLMENDGLNLPQLKFFSIDVFLSIYHSQELLASAIQPGYPPDTTDRALALHLIYLLTDPELLAKETREESDEKLFVLRPFVFAAHKFDAYMAPWTLRDLPLHPYSADAAADSKDTQDQQPSRTAHQSNPFLADLTPRSRKCIIQHCGMQIAIASPVLSHAACFSFFLKVERDPAVIGLTAIIDRDQTGGQPADDGSNRVPGGRGPHRTPLAVLRSTDHDRDVARLLACLDPRSSPGLKPLFFAGAFKGAWEGRFSFFDFDSYRDMLAGRMRSLYEGPFGEQPQVWKMKEHLVRIPRGGREGGRGSILAAGYFVKNETSETLDDPTASLTGTDRLFAPLGSGGAHSSDRHALPGPSSPNRRAGATTAGGAPPGFEGWPGFDEADERDGEGGEEEEEGAGGGDRMEILLSGTGHSAWGQFVLRGRVRSWDGLMTVTKEYRPDGRGRWLYRGYAVAGGMVVGRWRDTFTPDNMSGYEGCFLMSRRDSR